MKNKIAIASAFLAASSFSFGEIAITDNLSFEGFVDMSYVHFDTDLGAGGSESDNSFAVDQVEIDWLFDFEKVTGQIDLQYEGNRQFDETNEDSGDLEIFEEVIVEQAFATYHLDNGAAISAGRYASMLGFEAFEPTGLYQFSFAYDIDVLLPGYNQGVKYTQESDTTFFGISLQDSVTGNFANRLGGDDDTDEGGYGLEAAAAFTPGNGVTFFLGGAFENGDEDQDTYIVNGYVTYETGAWVFAAELNYGEQESAIDDDEYLSGLLMANFAYSDQASITGRVSYIETDGDIGEEEWYKLTLAHGYAFTDNLLLVTEISYSEFDTSEDETLLGAVELLFTF